MDQLRLGKYFLIRPQQRKGASSADLVLEMKDSIDRPGTLVVTGQMKSEEQGNEHQLWFYDHPTMTIRSKRKDYCMTEKGKSSARGSGARQGQNIVVKREGWPER